MINISSAPRSRTVMARCFLAAAAGACASGGTTWMQPILFQYLISARAMHEANAGLLITAELGAMAAASMVAAHLVQRWKAQLFAIGGMMIAILASVASLMAPGVGWLFVCRIVVGLGLGATIMISNIIAANFPDPDKTFAHLGLANLGYGAVVVGAYGFLLQHWPGLTPFGFLTLSLMALFPAMANLPRFSKFDHAGLDMPHGTTRMSASMRLRTLLLATVTLLVVISSGIVWSLYSIIGQEAGLSVALVNRAIAMSVVAGLLGAGLPAIMGARAGRIAPFIAGLTVMVVAISVLVSRPNANIFFVAVCANVASIYFLMPYISGAAAAIDGGGNAAAYVGSTFFLGSAISPLMAGVLLSTVGVSLIGLGVAVVAVICSVLFIQAERLRHISQGNDARRDEAIAAHIPVLSEYQGEAVATRSAAPAES